MFKATREFIKYRQPHTIYELEVVIVNKTNSAIANKCYDNAYDECNKGIVSKIISGWIVNRFDSATNSTAIVQHWWNIDSNGNYYDTTPCIDNNFEYVVDCVISEYGHEHFNELKDMVASSLLYKEGKFYAIRKFNGKLNSKQMPNLSTENIFRILPSEI